jgi:hypothetical protein
MSSLTQLSLTVVFYDTILFLSFVALLSQSLLYKSVIPPTISKFHQLTSLTLMEMDLTGALPSELVLLPDSYPT